MQRGPDLAMARDRRFESTFLQRRVLCEPASSREKTLTGVSPMPWSARQVRTRRSNVRRTPTLISGAAGRQRTGPRQNQPDRARQMPAGSRNTIYPIGVVDRCLQRFGKRSKRKRLRSRRRAGWRSWKAVATLFRMIGRMW